MIHVQDRVRVVSSGEEDVEDVCFPMKHLGKVGYVLRRECSDVGATPRDPLYIVKFSDGSSDGFWAEELRAVSQG